MTIEPLSEEEIRTLVAGETGVNAYGFLSLITQIAQGNPRLALMAARVVRETGSGAALADISALYDEYYRSIRRDLNLALDPGLLLAAGVVAFFRQVDRANTEQMAAIQRAFGLTPDALWSAVRKLHEIEAVDLYDNEVVKVADQVLATYLLFLAMFRERVLQVRVLLDHFFPRLRHRLVDALNPMFAVFDTDKLVETLTTEVREARTAMLARGDDEAALHALDLFWFALPSDALQYADAFIAGLPKATSPLTEFRESRDATPVPSALSILSRFSRAAPELRRTALQLVARYAERDPAAVPHLVRTLREDYGIEPDSPAQGYAGEHAVLEALLTESDEGRKPGATGLLLAYVQSLLLTRIQRTCGTRNGIQIVRFDLPDSPELARLRRRAWEVVGLALRSGRNREAALALLRAHASSGYQVGNVEIVGQDAKLVIPLLREHVNLEVYAEVAVAHAYFDHMRRVGLTVPTEVLAHFTTPAVEVAELVLDDWLDRRELGYEEYRGWRHPDKTERPTMQAGRSVHADGRTGADSINSRRGCTSFQPPRFGIHEEADFLLLCRIIGSPDHTTFIGTQNCYPIPRNTLTRPPSPFSSVRHQIGIVGEDEQTNFRNRSHILDGIGFDDLVIGRI